MPIFAVYGAIAAIIFTLGAGVSWKVTSDHYEAKHAKDDRVAREDFQTAVLGMNQLSAALQGKKSEQKTVYRTIQKEVPVVVDRPVYRNECVDDDGLRLVNEALAGKLRTSGHDAAVPAAEPVGR